MGTHTDRIIFRTGASCAMAYCCSTKRIIMHWQNCTISSCLVCIPFKRAIFARLEHEALDEGVNDPSSDSLEQFSAFGTNNEWLLKICLAAKSAGVPIVCGFDVNTPLI